MLLFTTLGRYLTLRFTRAILSVFSTFFFLIGTLDFVELMRRAGDSPIATTPKIIMLALYRVPSVAEQIFPFAALFGGMFALLTLSRKLELVVARSAGVSAWQFTRPALVSALAIGALATLIYNPMSAFMQERAKEMEAQLFSDGAATPQENARFWVNQVTSEGQAIINATTSRAQGERLTGLTVFRFDTDGGFKNRIEAREATLEPGRWHLRGARIFTMGEPPQDHDSLFIATSLTRAQVRNSFATPETVSFWQLPDYIKSAENSGLAASGYRLQYQKLLAQPFLLCAMVMLAAAVSLRFFRFGGVQKMVLSGVAAGFLLYVLSKVTEDLSKAELMHPLAAAWLPVCVGGLSGFLALLYQEDG